MEEQYFNEIRNRFIAEHQGVTDGKMMHSQAIKYNDDVFAFFSKHQKMVFKLGKEFDPDQAGVEIAEFNPFKNKGPLKGWFEVPYTEKEQWVPLAKQALDYIKNE